MTPRFAIIGLVVRDVAASIAFYERLGLVFGEPAGDGHIEAELPGGTRLALDTEDIITGFHPGWRRPDRGGQLNLGFECADPAEVDALFHDLVDTGCHGELAPFDAAWGCRWSTVLDPDGNATDIYALLPASG